MRQWIIEILQYVALRIGTRQAVVLAEELKVIQRSGLFSTPSLEQTTLTMPEDGRTRHIETYEV